MRWKVQCFIQVNGYPMHNIKYPTSERLLSVLMHRSVQCEVKINVLRIYVTSTSKK